MKNIFYILFSVFFWLFSLNVQAEWRLTGPGTMGNPAILTVNPSNSQEFIFVGKLNDQPFKITDGTTTYVHSCGDNDPLEQSITLQEQLNAGETGLRIRYVGHNQYFKVKLTDNRYSTEIIAEPITPPQNLYIIGGPFNNNNPNWLLEDAIELERDADNPFVFWYRGDIRYNPIGDEGGNLKILLGRSWSENYHPAASGNVPLNEASQMRLGGEDNKWSIPADKSGDGYYVIKINTLDLTISVEEFIHNIDESPLAIFITGDAMTCGWSNSAPMQMKKIQPGVYSWQGTVLQGTFKLLKRKGNWGMCYVATSSDEQVVVGNEHNIIYEFEYYNNGGNDYKFVMPEPGEYRFTVNLNTMKMRVDRSATGLNTLPEDNSTVCFSGNGKLSLKSTSNQALQAAVFGIDGRKITKASFVGYTEISLPKGFYIVILNDVNGKKIAGHKIIVY